MNDLEIIKQLCDVDVPYNEICSIEANALGEIQEAAERMANRIAELEKAEPVVCDCCAFQPNCRESIVMTGEREYCDEWVTINSCSHGKRKPLEDK